MVLVFLFHFLVSTTGADTISDIPESFTGGESEICRFCGFHPPSARAALNLDREKRLFPHVDSMYHESEGSKESTK